MRWLGRLFRKSRAEKNLDKELRFHLEQQIADYVARGMSTEEARRRAQLGFGGLERVKEEVRDTRWETHLENLLRDFRYAFRNLRKDRGFSLIVIFALALGISSCTIVFSVVYSALFNALPYKYFGRSVVVRLNTLVNTGLGKERKYFSPEEVRAFQKQNHVFEDVIVYAGFRPAYDNGHFIRNFANGTRVTTNTFDYLGVPPLLDLDRIRIHGPGGSTGLRLLSRQISLSPTLSGPSAITVVIQLWGTRPPETLTSRESSFQYVLRRFCRFPGLRP